LSSSRRSATTIGIVTTVLVALASVIALIYILFVLSIEDHGTMELQLHFRRG
jgi:hypothetical protein